VTVQEPGTTALNPCIGVLVWVGQLIQQLLFLYKNS